MNHFETTGRLRKTSAREAASARSDKDHAVAFAWHSPVTENRTATVSGPSRPICSMYEIFSYIWVFFGAHVGKYSIHGAYGRGGGASPRKEKRGRAKRPLNHGQ